MSKNRAVRVGCLQMPVKLAAVDENLAAVEKILDSLKPRSLDLLCLPEMWTTDYATPDTANLVFQTQAALERLEKQAKRLECCILGSALGGKMSGKPKAKKIYYNQIQPLGLGTPKSSQSAIYKKIHLFRPLKEDRLFAPGHDLVVLRTPPAKVGLSICYDLRFPELYRALASKGAELIVVPSAWPASRLSHWQTLLRARAIENQVFVIGINRVGQSPRGFAFAGSSMVVNPWGETFWQASEENTAFAIVEINLAEIEAARRKITLWKDRRPDLYCAWETAKKSKKKRKKPR